MDSYFIPKIEDLKENYQFEYQEYDEELDIFKDNWIKTNFDSREGLGHDLTYQFQSENVRCEFLTKEQIESEGWALQEEFPYVHSIGLIKNLTYRGTNHTVFLYYNYSSKWLLITIQSVIDNIYSIKYTTEKTDININGNTLYAGTCLDINTFRYICKLLEI